MLFHQDRTNFDPSAVACKCLPGCLSYIPSKEELLPPPPSFWPHFFFSPSRGTEILLGPSTSKLGGIATDEASKHKNLLNGIWAGNSILI